MEDNEEGFRFEDNEEGFRFEESSGSLFELRHGSYWFVWQSWHATNLDEAYAMYLDYLSQGENNDNSQEDL